MCSWISTIVAISAMLQVSSCLSLPSVSGGIEQPAVVIITTQEQGRVGEGVETTTDYAVEYEKLLLDKNRVDDIVYYLNLTSLGQMQAAVNNYFSADEKEAIAYCEETIRATTTFNGTLSVIDEGGCNFTIQCTYKRDRFPSLLLHGICVSYRDFCGGYTVLKRCAKEELRVPILSYQPSNGYHPIGGEESTDGRPTSYDWVEGRELIVTGCLCS